MLRPCRRPAFLGLFTHQANGIKFSAMVVSHRLSGLLAALALWLVPARLAAQPVDDATRATARELGMSGVEAYQAGNYAAAREKLDKAYRALKAPSLGLWSARALAKLGQLIEASERYLEVTRLDVTSGDAAVQKQAQAEAATEREALLARIPSIVVQLETSDSSPVTVLLDGTPIPNSLLGEKRPVNPGRHQVEASQREHRAKLEITLAEGAHETVRLDLSSFDAGTPTAKPDTQPVIEADAPATSGSALRSIGLVVGGLGVVGLGVGTGFAVRARGLDADAKDDGHCNNTGCDATGRPLNLQALQAADISTVSFIAGGVLVAAGVTLYVVGGRSRTESEVSLGVSPLIARGENGVWFHGAF
jgi:hypothetical protein